MLTVPTETAPRRRVDKRRAVLDAAAEVFGTVGYERASIDAIAAQAGVSKPTIYSYFGTKEQLFRESIGESAAQVNGQSMAAILALDTGPEHWREALHRLATALLECQRSPCAQSLQRQIHAEITRDPEVFESVRSRAAEPILEALAGRLAMLGNAGFLRIPDPRLAARQFLALIGAEMPERTRLGTRPIDDAELAAAAAAGVDTFLLAYAAR
jgi:TetR/AcrR family transcriptional regulator, mexJK operon transcriptional repressor